MKDEEIINKMSYLEGWKLGVFEQELVSPSGESFDMSYYKIEEVLPRYLEDHNILHILESRYDDPNNLEKRVKWLNSLRTIVGVKKPKNKSGQSLVSDYDMLRASCRERCEAMLKTEGEWNK